MNKFIIFTAIIFLASCADQVTKSNASNLANQEISGSFEVKALGGPIKIVAPCYPRSAAAKGIEGWVITQFDVDEYGTPFNIVVTDAQPSGYFESCTLKAVAKFKYKPLVIDGKAVVVHGVQNRNVFAIN